MVARVRCHLKAWVGVASLVAVCAMGVMKVALAAIVPLGQEPQILIILDNSQGMAGTLQGAIMSGSGTVPQNLGPSALPAAAPPLADPSPLCYSLPSGYSSRAPSLGPSNGGSCPTGSAPYTVDNGGVLQDNSESMINIAEQSLLAQFDNPANSNAFQIGLMDYATASAPTLYQTWVYYMSNFPFPYGNSLKSPSAIDSVTALNPCYQSTSASCQNIEAIEGTGLGDSQYIYMQDTSDDPEINDVLYDIGAPSNILTYGGPYSCFNGSCSAQPPYQAFTLQEYEDQIVNNAPLLEVYNNSTGGINATSPTSAGYIPYTPSVWYGERGYAYDAPPVTDGTTGGQGNLLVDVAPFTTSLATLNQDLAPEQFPAGQSIVADSEYAPMAGALLSAFNYLTGSNGPKPTCAPKYVILITDGQPTMGLNGHVYPPLGSAAAIGYGETTSDDYAVTEAETEAQKLFANSGAAGSIKTYVLGVGPNIDCPSAGSPSGGSSCTPEAQAGYQVLAALAKDGGTTTPYSANSSTQFQQAFAAILNSIQGQVLTANGGSSTSTYSGSDEYELNSSPSLGEGNMTAYPILSNGQTATTEAWDAEQYMTTGGRTAALYSNGPTSNTGTPGPLTPIASLDSAAFGNLTGTGLTVSDIQNYTIDPSYQGGIYLGGRASSWFIGITSQAKAVVVGPPNNSSLLSDPSYVTYAQANYQRPPIVLFGDNDGFLYAVNANASSTGPAGSLLWAWMPRPLVSELSAYGTFWHNSNMSGNVKVVDAMDSGGAWQSYIVGYAAHGQIQYALDLNSNATLNSEVWEQDNPNVMEPDPTKIVTFRPSPGSTTDYVATVLQSTNSTTVTSSLVITNVATGSSTSYTLPFTATTQAFVDSSDYIYIGDSSSNVWEAPLFTTSGGFSKLNLSKTWVPLNNSSANPAATSFGTSSTTSGGASSLTYIGGAYENGFEYLRLQSATRLTVIENESNGWEPVWTSYVSSSSTGGDSWDPATGTYVSNPNIPSLPAGSVISNPGRIVNGAIQLPVTQPASSGGVCAEPPAYNYLYQLGDGYFPVGAFFGIGIGIPIPIGYGIAYTPSLSLFNGQMRIQTAAEQNLNHQAALGPAVLAAGPPAEGPAGWREIFP